jgi:hypothetical protein
MGARMKELRKIGIPTGKDHKVVTAMLCRLHDEVVEAVQELQQWKKSVSQNLYEVADLIEDDTTDPMTIQREILKKFGDKQEKSYTIAELREKRRKFYLKVTKCTIDDFLDWLEQQAVKGKESNE